MDLITGQTIIMSFKWRKQKENEDKKDEGKDDSFYSPPGMHEEFSGKYRGKKLVPEASKS